LIVEFKKNFKFSPRRAAHCSRPQAHHRATSQRRHRLNNNDYIAARALPFYIRGFRQSMPTLQFSNDISATNYDNAISSHIDIPAKYCSPEHEVDA
jgi:hypothetical protein